MKKVLLFALAGAAVGLIAHLDDKSGCLEEGKPKFTDRLVANLEKLPPVIEAVLDHFHALNDEQAGNAHDNAPADAHDNPSDAGDSAAATA